MDITLNPEAAIAAGAGFTALTVIAGSWIGHIHYLRVHQLKAKQQADEVQLALTRETTRQVIGPDPSDVLNMAAAEEKLAKAIERRATALKRIAELEAVD